MNEELSSCSILASGVHEYSGLADFAPGRQSIQSVNNYDLGVFNGDIGYVQETRVDGGA